MNQKQAAQTVNGLPDAARVCMMDGQAVVYLPLEAWPSYEEAIQALTPQNVPPGREAPEP